jgi:hypothetical protein
MAATKAKRTRRSRPVLDRPYRALIEWAESLPENQSGSDKTWMELALLAIRRHYASAQRVR